MIAASPIDDYSTSILLRHFKGITPITPGAPRIVNARDLEFLHYHWSISEPVKSLASYLLDNRHETQTLLTFRNRTDDAVARGRIDARATMLQRMRSGLPTAVVSAEPVRTYANGPNQVLAWVLNQSFRMALKFVSSFSLGPGYQTNTESAIHLLDQVRRMEFFRSVATEMPVTRRPLASSLIAAQRSRRKLYRLAYDAYQLFVAIERGDQDVIASLLKNTLLVPLENWRRLELAVALAAGEAISSATGKPLDLAILGLDAKTPILRCGPYAIYWQTPTNLYTQPPLEASEQKAQEIFVAYGLSASGDRPDLIVINEVTRELISIIEVKFHAGDNPTARFREAIYQIVRYGRGYNGDPDAIMERSVVAMNTTVPLLEAAIPGIPVAFSFDDILNYKFATWVAAKWLS